MFLCDSLKMMGHKAAVLVARYNPRMFRAAGAGAPEPASSQGGAPAKPPELCLALGSQVRAPIERQDS